MLIYICLIALIDPDLITGRSSDILMHYQAAENGLLPG